MSGIWHVVVELSMCWRISSSFYVTYWKSKKCFTYFYQLYMNHLRKIQREISKSIKYFFVIHRANHTLSTQVMYFLSVTFDSSIHAWNTKETFYFCWIIEFNMEWIPLKKVNYLLHSLAWITMYGNICNFFSTFDTFTWTTKENTFFCLNVDFDIKCIHLITIRILKLHCK